MNSRTMSILLAIAAMGSSSPVVAAKFQIQPFTPPVATPRRVVCVSAGNDAYLSGVEGYYRGLPQKGEADVVIVGMALADCMANARKGDQLIIVAHGARGTFLWDDAKGGAGPVQHGGFGAGSGVGGNPHPVPPNLVGTNHVTATVMSCCSDADPPGLPVSVVESLRNAMGGTDNTCAGNARDVNANTGVGVANCTTEAQYQAAQANLANNTGWMNNPPANRHPAPATSQQAAAQAQINAAFPGKQITVTITYGEPELKAPGQGQEQLGIDPCDVAPPGCGGSFLNFNQGPAVPGLPAAGAVVLAGLLLGTALLLLPRVRRRMMGSAES